MKKFLWKIALLIGLLMFSKNAYAEKIAVFKISGQDYEVTTPYLNCAGKCDAVLKDLKSLQKTIKDDYSYFEKKEKVTYGEMFDTDKNMDQAIVNLDKVWIKIIQGAYNKEILNEYVKTEELLYKVQSDKFEKLFIGKNPNILNYPEAIEKKREIFKNIRKNVDLHLKQVDFLRSKMI